MPRILRSFAALSLLWVATGSAAVGQSDEQAIFDGRSLDGWYGNNPHVTAKAENREQSIAEQQSDFEKHWYVEDGDLVNDGHGPYATTRQEYGDIELALDYRTVAKADSGIYLRGTPQVQIWDTTEAGGKWDRNADKGSGGLFNNSKGAPGQLPLMHADRPFGEWNHFRIWQIGARTWVELNDKLVVDGAIMENYWDRKLPLPPRGPIHLQTHGGEIRWKNITVREIGEEEATVRLRGDDALQGFDPIFNGQDLSGWGGAVDDYEVRDGAIVCKPERGGVLHTEESYDDFVVRLEFQLPPGGNNGLAIRYSGEGRAAYDAMCELQILDDDAEKYATLDPRQYHGSIYGIVPAHRGYLRPAGHWNYQEVTVRGSHIQVELNGSRIVDADVSQVKEFKDDAPHPGLTRTSGYFGFAGHNDPVAFRNIAIKRLPKQEPVADQGKDAADTSLIFHAPFDGSFDAKTPDGPVSIQTAGSSRRENATTGNQIDAVAIAAGQGISGDALRFSAKTERVLFYPAVGFQTEDWSGTVSMWLKLDPEADLEPGFCDPIQITERGWNDGAFFVDFDKELPRDFRLGVFPDYATWNPTDEKFDDIPLASRPMVVVEDPPFSADTWTHVCFTWSGVNSEQPATASLYLNGEPQGELSRPMQFTWDADKAALMLGLNYIGLMDEVKVFDRALTPSEIQQLRHQR